MITFIIDGWRYAKRTHRNGKQICHPAGALQMPGVYEKDRKVKNLRLVVFPVLQNARSPPVVRSASLGTAKIEVIHKLTNQESSLW